MRGVKWSRPERVALDTGGGPADAAKWRSGKARTPVRRVQRHSHVRSQRTGRGVAPHRRSFPMPVIGWRRGHRVLTLTRTPPRAL